jgi:hypothetical protein
LIYDLVIMFSIQAYYTVILQMIILKVNLKTNYIPMIDNIRSIYTFYLLTLIINQKNRSNQVQIINDINTIQFFKKFVFFILISTKLKKS